MYAIIRAGGRQYRVSEGQTLRVDRLSGDKGTPVVFDQVLLLGGEDEPRVGQPLVDGASVDAEILSQGRAKKLIVFKKKRRKGYHKKQGHRQQYTELRIMKITG